MHKFSSIITCLDRNSDSAFHASAGARRVLCLSQCPQIEVQSSLLSWVALFPLSVPSIDGAVQSVAPVSRERGAGKTNCTIRNHINSVDCAVAVLHVAHLL